MSQDKTPVVLTIDDDQAVRESLANFLEDFGYNVLQAEDGEHGIELWTSDGTKEGTYMLKDINPAGETLSKVRREDTSP